MVYNHNIRRSNVVIVLSLMLLVAACGTPSPFPLSFPSSKDADDRIVGNWKLAEDTNKHNFYEITKASVEHGLDHQYHVRFFNQGGSNPSYEANIFFSKVNNSDNGRFLNIPYWENISMDNRTDKPNSRGYFFVRILETNADFSKITTATVNDPAISGIKTAFDLSRYMSANMDDPGIYSDTVHFYKVKETTAQLRKPRK